MNEKRARVVFSPLEFVFTMMESGGAPVQKYDTISGEYTPDRQLTPYLLQPAMSLRDPTGYITPGDHTKDLVNCKWYENGVELTNTDSTDTTQDYVIQGQQLIVKKNIDPDTSDTIKFEADYLDTRRNDVSHFTWQKTLSSIPATEFALNMSIDAPNALLLSPFHMEATKVVSCQIYNGSTPVDDNLCTYKWQVFEDNAWRDITDDDLWCAGGYNTKSVTLIPAKIQEILIRCIGKVNQVASNDRFTMFKNVTLKRWYGYYEGDLIITEGAYILPTTTRIAFKIFVTNHEGNIASPTKYFDLQTAVSLDNGKTYQPLAYGETAAISRSVSGNNDVIPKPIVSELTASLPILYNGKRLLINGAVLTAQTKINRQ